MRQPSVSAMGSSPASATLMTIWAGGLMPAELDEGHTSISCLFSDGRRHRRDLAGTGPTALVADLLTGLAAMIHPHGSIDSPATMDRYLTSISDMAGFMT